MSDPNDEPGMTFTPDQARRLLMQATGAGTARKLRAVANLIGMYAGRMEGLAALAEVADSDPDTDAAVVSALNALEDAVGAISDRLDRLGDLIDQLVLD